MLVHHEYQVGSIVLAKADSYPHWPAKVVACLKNGGYKVVFLEEKSEAIMLPHMIRKLDYQNLYKLKKEKYSTHRDILNESIRITERILEERERGNRVLEESVAMGIRRVQTRRNGPIPHQNANETLTNPKNQSSEKDIYAEIRHLLDKLSKYSARMSIPNKSIIFTEEDQARLDALLGDKDIDIKKLINQYLIDRLVLTIQELELWMGKGSYDYIRVLKERLSSIEKIARVQVMNQQDFKDNRRKSLLQRLQGMKQQSC